jgi:hypothetical protein
VNAGRRSTSEATVRLGSDGKIALFNGTWGTVQLIADVSGFYVGGSPSTPGSFHTLKPERLLDTIAGIGAPKAAVRAHGTLRLQVAGRAGVPAGGASSVVLTIHARQPAAGGTVIAYPDGTRRPGTANLAVTRGLRSSGEAVVALGSGGKIDLYNNTAGPAQFAADVSGYFLSGAPTTPATFHAVKPVRLLNTATSSMSLGPHRLRTLQVAGRAGIPANRVLAVVVTVQVPHPRAAGTVVFYADGAYRPATTTVAFNAGQRASSAAIVRLGASGELRMYNGSAGRLDVIVDVSGYLTSDALSWSGPSSIDPDVPYGFQSVSCADPDFCVGVDAGGRALTYTSGGWSEPVDVRPGPLLVVSCAPGTTFCVTADDRGSVFTTSNGVNWSSPKPAPTGATAIVSLSCVTTTFCAASDQYGTLLIFDGSGWRARYDNGTTNTFTGDAVSCPTTMYCVAVPREAAGASSAIFDGATWSPGPEVPGGMSAISCPTTTFCAAVADGRIALFDGSQWTSQSTPARLDVVSCASATFCAATDYDGNATLYNGTGWTTPTSVDAGHSVEVSCPSTVFCLATDMAGYALTYHDGAWTSPNLVDRLQGNPQAVSCPTNNFCAAVDRHGNVLTYDGASWSAPTNIDSNWEFVSISCATSSFCAALDRRGYALTYDGSQWSAPVDVGAGHPGAAIACPASGSCVATFIDPFGTGNFWAFWARYSQGSWGAVTPLAARVAATNLSCPTQNFCALVTTTYDPDKHYGQAMTYDGTTWSSPKTIDNKAGLSSLSCWANDRCIALDVASTQFTYDGTSWRTVAVPVQVPVAVLSCTSATSCLAVRRGEYAAPDEAMLFDGLGWGAPQLLPTRPSTYDLGGSAVYALDCSAPRSCVALTRGGVAVRSS